MTTSSNVNEATTKKSVRFCDALDIKVYKDDCILAERNCMYYTACELRGIRRELGSAYRKRSLESDDFSWRGLEHLKNGTCEDSQEHRYAFLKQFLSLQFDHLRRWNKNKPADKEEGQQILRTFAENHSKDDRQVARLKGKRDEIDAKKLYKEAKIRWQPPSVLNQTQSASTPKPSSTSFKSMVRCILPLREQSTVASTA